jgi:hypothetical protein
MATRISRFYGWCSGCVATHCSCAPDNDAYIGWLSVRSSDTKTETNILAAFSEGLAPTAYVEGKNLTLEYRFSEGQ